jgi:hypothetical protein
MIRRTGEVIDTPGWDAKTGLLYIPDPTVQWPTILTSPKTSDVADAIAVLLDPVLEFPFIDGNDPSTSVGMAVYMSLIFSLLARHLIKGPVPLHAVRSPMGGTGKNLIVNVASIICTGRVASTATLTHEEELYKHITSLVLAGVPLVQFEDVEGSIHSKPLERAITSEMWQARKLKTNDDINMPQYIVWVTTGNNYTFRSTFERRFILLELDAKVERPADRSGFRYSNLLEHVHTNRPQLVAAALTILRAFFKAGRPHPGYVPMGGFKAWEEIVRSAVIWAGLADPGDRERIREEMDDEAADLNTLFLILQEMFPDGKTFTAADVVNKASLTFLDATQDQPRSDKQAQEVAYQRAQQWRTILLGVEGVPNKQGDLDTVTMGLFLRSKINNYAAGLRLERIRTSARVKHYRVVNVQTAAERHREVQEGVARIRNSRGRKP